MQKEVATDAMSHINILFYVLLDVLTESSKESLSWEVLFACWGHICKAGLIANNPEMSSHVLTLRDCMMS